MDLADHVGWKDVSAATVATFSFAVALPVLNLLRENPEFFVARGFLPLDYFVFVFGLAVGIPALIVGLVLAVPSKKIRRVLFYGIVGFFLGLVALQAVKQLPATNGLPTPLQVVISATLGAAGVVAMGRWDSVRMFLRICSALPLILIVLFLFSSPVVAARSTPDSTIEPVAIGNAVPVVFLIFDELPVTSLLRTDGTINGERFPNFVRLAEHTTWFRNAFANSASTSESVPSMLSGRYPDRSSPVPVTSNYPENLFTLLGDQYSVVGDESVTMLCPGDVCRDPRPLVSRWRSLPTDTWYVLLHLTLPESLTASLPAIDEDWANFGVGVGSAGADDPATSDSIEVDDSVTSALLSDRNRSFTQFVSEIAPSDRGSLYFHHSLMPHRPWEYLPSGQSYRAHPRVPGTDRSIWTHQEFLVDQGYQRHLLQVGMADLMVGQVLDHLEEQGLIDEALIVVTSDHGIAFRPGEPMRGALEDRVGSVGAVPLFVSIGEAWEGTIVDAPVELVDILPTIALALEASVDWAFDGLPLQTTLSGEGDDGREILTFPGRVAHGDAAEQRQEVTLELAARYELDGDWDRLLKPGLSFDLVGLALSEAEIGTPLDWTVVLETLDDLDSVDLESETLPVLLEGWIATGGEDGSQFRIALALNGTISTVFETFDQARGDMISAMISRSDLRVGSNVLELFLVEDSEPGVRLRPILDVRSGG